MIKNIKNGNNLDNCNFNLEMNFVYNKEKYLSIIENICKIKGIEKEELCNILKDKDCTALLFLFMQKYNCLDLDELRKDFSFKTNKTLRNNTEKAEERFLVNKDFRELYFQIDKYISK